MTKLFTGLGTALITPFRQDGEVDYDVLRFLISTQVGTGLRKIATDFLVPCGTTGESPTLSMDEFCDIVETTVNASDGVPVVAGTGSNDTKKAVVNTVLAKEIGAEGALVVSPYYNKPTEKGLRDYYEKVANVGLPVILYDIPGRTARGVPTKLIIELAREGVICGVKWASGDYKQLWELINETPDDFSVLSGDDIFTLDLMNLGGDGVVSVLSNILPATTKQLLEFAVNNPSKAQELHDEFVPLMNVLFVETNPIPVKTAFYLIYGDLRDSPVYSAKPYFRSPMSEMAEENLDTLKDVLSSTLNM